GKFQVDSNGNLVKIDNITYDWPADDGDPGEQLQTDGDGILTWEAAGGAGSGDSVLIDAVAVADGSGVDLQGGADVTITFNAGAVDDRFLRNYESDAMIGTLTSDGLTMDASENITLGGQTLDHDGTDFVFNDSVQINPGLLLIQG
ncbi:hypothetical protein ACFL2J_07950, partial [Candidatus Omnitrophota bacterium]